MRIGTRGPATHRTILQGLLLAAFCVTAVRADQLVIGGENHVNAKVLGLDKGQVRVRLADGRTQGYWIDQIELIIVDRGGSFDDFNQAERFLSAGEAEKAAVRFERAMRLCGEFWPEICAARLATAYDRAGQIDKAAMSFIRVARGREAGPQAAARLIPRNIPAKRDAKFTRALDRLDSALEHDPGESLRVLFECLRYDLLRQTHDERAARSAGKIALTPVPDPVRSEQVYACVHTALQESMESEISPGILAALDRAIQDCPEGSLADFLLLKGEALLRTAVVRDDWIRASWPFLRVAAHKPGDVRAADGLWGGARALEKLGRPDQAVRLLEECVAHPQVRSPTRRSAEEALARLHKAKP